MNWEDLKIFLEVAKSETLTGASKRLGIDSSTVSRRLHKLESALGTQLFTRENQGHKLTQHGSKLLQTALEMEQKTQSAIELLQGKNLQQYGDIRLGTTDAFGNYFIASQLPEFMDEHQQINIELLPLQRSVKLAHHEADIAITIDKPTSESLVVAKLCDYRLKLYASENYLTRRGAVNNMESLVNHDMIGYVDDLIFSRQLCYLEQFLPHITPRFRSTSVIAQATAVESGMGIAILPCFLANRKQGLVEVLPNTLDIMRQFWIAAPRDRMELLRVKTLWHYLQQKTDQSVSQLIE
ncbi:LysR family transcriptional regulator [Psychrobium sp. MM17-31]|uniref:LysR family transcriptional regulator n=1 Tax=Psychrobium sp. MM17-31 TaxID=2917758 RepID=UPI001EF653D0|nr:LysR family transcriptional regulator [Psychrobium sp. MM17-31]MCG7530337.1 LysR family transcriptional regulator [Psychrobium sp. MM17-31]